MFRRDSAFAVIRRRKHVLVVKPRGKRRWQLPGGGVESKETPWGAALREVEEETGLPARILGLTGIYLRRDRSLAFVFAARAGWGKIARGGTREILKSRWVPVRKALRLLSRAARVRLLDALRGPARLRPLRVAGPERLVLDITAG